MSRHRKLDPNNLVGPRNEPETKVIGCRIRKVDRDALTNDFHNGPQTTRAALRLNKALHSLAVASRDNVSLTDDYTLSARANYLYTDVPKGAE